MNAFHPCYLLAHLSTFGRDISDVRKKIHLSLNHLRSIDPQAGLLVSGHGPGLNSLNISGDLCDRLIWDNRNLNSEVGFGHPFTVYRALLIAKSMGYTHIMKLKFDTCTSVRMLTSVLKHILEYYSRDIILTQQSSIERLLAGDLFVFAGIEEFLQRWNPTTWYPAENGLEAFCRSILNSYGNEVNVETWRSIFASKILHINIPSLGIINVDCIGCWHESGLPGRNSDNILSIPPEFASKFYWGSSEGWHTFSSNGECVSNPMSYHLSNDIDLRNFAANSRGLI